MSSKEDIRSDFLNKRKSLSLERRALAEKKILELTKLSYTNILSFASTGSEVNTWELNTLLCKEKRLYLPKINKTNLDIYKVNDIEKDLVKSTSFNIFEPIPRKGTKVKIDVIDCILVPAIVFDENNFRLGYGKGFYDRLLKSISITSIGIGFKEQLLIGCLPVEKHDIPIKDIFLY